MAFFLTNKPTNNNDHPSPNSTLISNLIFWLFKGETNQKQMWGSETMLLVAYSNLFSPLLFSSRPDFVLVFTLLESACPGTWPLPSLHVQRQGPSPIQSGILTNLNPSHNFITLARDWFRHSHVTILTNEM